MPRLTLHRKFLAAFLGLSLVPLGLLALYAATTLTSLADYLRVSATVALDRQAANSLEARAELVAMQVSDFLYQVEGDLRDFSLLTPDLATYRIFSDNHQREIWFRAGTNENPVERRERFPLYQEMAFVGADGRERVRLLNGHTVAPLRDVSIPANTSFRSEDYFLKARALPPGAIFVSHVNGWHVDRQQQLQGAESPEAAVEGGTYAGVIRFAMPVYRGTKLQGVAVLSLDHRHLMEFTQHILPTEERWTVFPSYASGNYAFMFDDQGWMIAHPKYWDIRGLDPDGTLVPPYRFDSTAADIEQGRIPFNLDAAGFVHANYPVVAAAVRAGQSGVVDVTNVGGSNKIMAYAPIPFRSGDYAGSGIFGGITIGAQLAQFHKPAQQAAEVIRQDLRRFGIQALLMIAATGLLVMAGAWALARSMSKPLLSLIEGTKAMARGSLSDEVPIRSHDEVGELADSFNRMVRELNDRSDRLMRTLDDLQKSRQEILRERNFKETVFEHIETGILTLDQGDRITSVNGPAGRMLGALLPGEGVDLAGYLADWPELLDAVREGCTQREKGAWNRYVPVHRAARVMTFRLALLPLAAGGADGWILTIEDLTERVNMRQRMARMERMVSLGRLSAGIAHEVRNPLTGISLLLDELHDRLLAQPGDQELIRRALNEIERLEALVNELLHFASLPQEPLVSGNLSEVVGETLFLFRRQCQLAGVELDARVAEVTTPVAMNASKLKQALLNLLTNALDAMPAGGTLTVGVMAASDGIIVTIRDTGEGIPAERLALIFEPFFTTKGEGTGLGLSITHNIVSDHGGRIEVESVPGHGTLFTLWFPSAAAQP